MNHTATYSPDDNKIRIYPAYKLPTDEYEELKTAGYKWAPAQKLFVAPMWTPAREDVAIKFAGEIDDEDTSLTQRAAERAERFEDYSANRAKDAENARNAVNRIADGIPMGQPILVGHHSERHARRDAEKIDNGMRKSVKCWEQAQYWQDRAAGAIHHAKYKEQPAVRARRIKGIAADKRKIEKSRAESAKLIAFYTDPEAQGVTLKDGRNMIAAMLSSGWDAGLSYEDSRKVEKGEFPIEEAKAKAIRNSEAYIRIADRWIAHYNNRIAYETAMLGEAGGIPAEQFDLKVGGKVLARNEWVTVLRVNKSAGKVSSVTTNARYVRKIAVEEIKDYQPPTEEEAKTVKAATAKPPICNFPGEGFIEKTAEEVKKHWSRMEYFPATDDHDAYRARITTRPGEPYKAVQIFITDAKIKPAPSKSQGCTPKARAIAAIPEPVRASEPKPAPVVEAPAPEKPKPVIPSWQELQDMKRAAAAGVQVVVAEQFFPTPPEIAFEMAMIADPRAGDKVLEPSAGKGALLIPMMDVSGIQYTAIEQNRQLADFLRNRFDDGSVFVIQDDFLQTTPEPVYDRIVMNPPFGNGADIKHIQHALKFLKPGGRLVALCANGPRQQEKLMPAATTWRAFPQGSFKDQGTMVNVAMLSIDAPEI